MLEAGAQSRSVYLPGAGPWYNSQSGALMKPDKSGALKVPVTMDDVPSYLRGGYILPLRVGVLLLLSTTFEVLVTPSHPLTARYAPVMFPGHWYNEGSCSVVSS